MDIVLPTGAIPFMERFGDHTAGVALDCVLQVFEDLNACDFYDPTPTITPTNTPTPTVTPTITLTPTATCPQTTQYLEVELSENTKFKLILWNQPDFTSPATALCDYAVSGTAYGDLGTIYTAQESIDFAQHQHQFDLAGVLQPGEIVNAFMVLSSDTNGCVCPVDLVLPPNCDFCNTNFEEVQLSFNGGTGDFRVMNRNFTLPYSFFSECGYLYDEDGFNIEVIQNGPNQFAIYVNNPVTITYFVNITGGDCETPQFNITASSSSGSGSTPILNWNYNYPANPVSFTSSGVTFIDVCSNPQPIPTLYSNTPFFTDQQQLYYDTGLTEWIDWSTYPMYLSTGGTQLFAYVFAGNGLTTYGFPC
jgi:hypothetical protein